MSKLLIVIPSYNEADNIENVIKDWYKVVEEIGLESRLVIFDGSSKDGTDEIIRNLQKNMPQLDLQILPKCGHGATLHIAYKYALDVGAEYVFQTDADGQTISSEFWDFWVQREQYDMQVGYRKRRQDGFSRLIVTRTLRIILFLSFGLWIPDANTPFRLISVAKLKKHVCRIPEGHNLTNVLLTVSLEKAKEKVRYEEITFRPRQGGENSINFKQICKIGLEAIKDFSSIRHSI